MEGNDELDATRKTQSPRPHGALQFYPHYFSPIPPYLPGNYPEAYTEPTFASDPPPMPTPSPHQLLHGRSSQAQPSRRRYRSVQQKLDAHLALLVDQDWTLGHLFHHLFVSSDENGGKKKVTRTERHAQMVSKFLGGECEYGVGDILDLWMCSPSGAPAEGTAEENCMYSMTSDFRGLKSARAAITTHAVSLVSTRLETELRRAIKKQNGLHTFSTKGGALSLDDYGAKTFQHAVAAFKTHQPLTWSIMLQLVTPKPRRKNGRVVVVRRVERPPELVTAQILSSLAFARNRYAKLVPASVGLLYFACSANRYMYSLGSRIGSSTSYHAVYDALKKQAAHDMDAVQKLGSSMMSAVMVRLDNVQSYVRPRDPRLARQAHMVVGIASTGFVVEGFNSAALDLSKKREKLAENKRKDLTRDALWATIDHEHIDIVCVLQWLDVLVSFVPQLAKYKAAVQQLYVNDIKDDKHCSPKNRQTKVYPLPTNGRNETHLTELQKGLEDILASIGQTPDNFIERLIFIGGDGLTFERMVQLKNIRQAIGKDAFESGEILEPFLEIWHTEWTDLCRIYEAHFDTLTSRDPSSLGHSANKINRKAPSNLKKVDYYPFMQLAYQVLDARMLDCWRIHLCGKDGDLLLHFNTLESNNQLPTLEELKEKARSVYNMYGSIGAYHRAMRGIYTSEATRVPHGTPWVAPTEEESSARAKKTRGGKKPGTYAKQPTTDEMENFEGDQVLARTCRFIFDATVSRETMRAVAQGHIGRVWECLKMMIFTFAGSSHTKYTAYLLEMFCRLEFELSSEARKMLLDNWLVNPSGIPGHYLAGDKFQEQLQDRLYDQISPDQDFDDSYVREVIAPNVYRFERLKKDLTSGLGLSKRASKHIEPHHNPEIRKLLATYQGEELHLFRAKRSYGGDRTKSDDLGRGFDLLGEKKLASWIRESLRPRGVNHKQDPGTESEQDDGDEDQESINGPQTRGSAQLDGEGNLIIDVEAESESGDEGLEAEDSMDESDNGEL